MFKAETEIPDVIVLDLGLPDVDGMQVCRALRQSGNRTPILMLTARDTVSDRIDGLDAGADDYLRQRPMTWASCQARLRALMRRPPSDGADAVARCTSPIWSSTPTPTPRGSPDVTVDLTRTEFQLLEAVHAQSTAGAVFGAGSTTACGDMYFGPRRAMRCACTSALSAPQAPRPRGETSPDPDGAQRRLRAARVVTLRRRITAAAALSVAAVAVAMGVIGYLSTRTHLRAWRSTASFSSGPGRRSHRPAAAAGRAAGPTRRLQDHRRTTTRALSRRRLRRTRRPAPTPAQDRARDRRVPTWTGEPDASPGRRRFSGVRRSARRSPVHLSRTGTVSTRPVTASHCWASTRAPGAWPRAAAAATSPTRPCTALTCGCTRWPTRATGARCRSRRCWTEDDHVLHSLLITYALLIGGGIVLAIVLGGLIGRSALRPIERRHAANRRSPVGAAGRHQRIRGDGGAGAGAPGGQGFNRTLDALEASVAAQRHLVADTMTSRARRSRPCAATSRSSWRPTGFRPRTARRPQDGDHRRTGRAHAAGGRDVVELARGTSSTTYRMDEIRARQRRARGDRAHAPARSWGCRFDSEARSGPRSRARTSASRARSRTCATDATPASGASRDGADRGDS